MKKYSVLYSKIKYILIISSIIGLITVNAPSRVPLKITCVLR